MITKIYSMLILLFLIGCSPIRHVKPLEFKQHAVNISLGGPLIKFGSATIPIPFISASYGYGLDTGLTLFSGFNITSALYGNAQIDLGCTKEFLKQKKWIPGISITPQLNFIYRNPDAYKLYPQMAINSYWEYNKKGNLIYCSLDNWFELATTRKYDVKQENNWIIVPTIGHVFKGEKWDFNIETKIIAPNLSNEKLVIEYKTPFKTNGAFGVYLSLTRKF